MKSPLRLVLAPLLWLAASTSSAEALGPSSQRRVSGPSAEDVAAKVSGAIDQLEPAPADGRRLTSLKVPSNALGDVDGNGLVNILDLLRVRDIGIGRGTPPSPSEIKAGDLNGDERVDGADAAYLRDVLLQLRALPHVVERAADLPLSEVSPCQARNPVVLLDHTFERTTGPPLEELVEFSLPVAAQVCLELMPEPGAGHDVTAGTLSLDGEVLLGPSDFMQSSGGMRTARTLSGGPHEFVGRLESKPGTKIRVRVIVAGPTIDSIDPLYASVGAILTLMGEGFSGPATLEVRGLALQSPTAEPDGRVATGVIPAALPIGPVTIRTPFGSATSAEVFVPATPKGVVRLFDRSVHPDPTGDGDPDITGVALVDDGHRLGIAATFAAALPPAASVAVQIQRLDRPEVNIQWSEGALVSAPPGTIAAVSGTQFALAMDLEHAGTTDLETLGRFSIVLTVTAVSGSDAWPDSHPFDARPIVAPRYLGYRATDPAAVAARHGAQYLLTAEDSDVSLMAIPPGMSLDEAMDVFIADPDAIGVFPDPMVYATYVPTGMTAPCITVAGAPTVDTGTDPVIAQWNLDAIGAPDAWANNDLGLPSGAGVTVIVADTGVNDHDEFAGGVDFLAAQNLISGAGDDVSDPSGHGTAVAGIIAARAANGGIAGVAPGAKVIPFRILQANGTTDEFTVAFALNRAMKMQDSDPTIRAINFSMAESEFWMAVADEVEDHYYVETTGGISWRNWPSLVGKEAAERMVVVAAAGNSGSDPVRGPIGSTYPATIEGAINVGAVVADGSGVIAAWPGTTPDTRVAVAAPGGFSVGGAAAIQSTSHLGPTQLSCLGGTSAASAHVAGAAAVLMSGSGCGGNLSPAAVRDLLRRTVQTVDGTPGQVGAGMIRLDQAVETMNESCILPHATSGGITRGAPVLDTGFAQDNAYFLLPDGTAVAPDPPVGQGEFSPIPLGRTASFIVGDPEPAEGGADLLLAGAVGSPVITVLRVSGGMAVGSPSSVTLPAPVAAEAVIVSGRPDATNQTPRRALVPIVGGLASITLHDGFFAVTSLINLPGAVGLSSASQRSIAAAIKRVAVVSSFGPSSVVHLLRYDVNANTATIEGNTPLLFTPSSIAVTNVKLTAPMVGGPGIGEYPVWLSDGLGHAAIAGISGGVARFVPFTLPGDLEVIASPNRAVVYGYDRDVIWIFGSRTAIEVTQIPLAQGSSISAASISAGGSRLAFSDAHNYFNPNRPRQPHWYYALLVFNL